jgi:hypothetical protein
MDPAVGRLLRLLARLHGLRDHARLAWCCAQRLPQTRSFVREFCSCCTCRVPWTDRDCCGCGVCTDTALTSNLQLPWLGHATTKCISGTLLPDGPARTILPENPSCEYYAQVPAQMCVTKEAREKCCECGGGAPTANVYELCQVAYTSLNRAIEACSGNVASPCNNSCVAAWSSVIRDAESVVGISCPSLELLVNDKYPGTVTGDGIFRSEEFLALKTRCSISCPANAQYCGLAQNDHFTGVSLASDSFSLRPPFVVCPYLRFANDIASFSVLTWQVLDYYARKSWACRGGVSLLADTESLR